MEGETLLDIGGGFGTRFIDEARKNPNNHYLIIDPDSYQGKGLPHNLKWIVGGITEDKSLPMEDNSADETNIDCVLIWLYGEDQETLIPKLITEAVRVTKPGKKILIREQKFMLKILKPILKRLGLTYTIQPISVEEAKKHSVSLKDAALEFEAGYQDSQPFLIAIQKAS